MPVAVSMSRLLSLVRSVGNYTRVLQALPVSVSVHPAPFVWGVPFAACQFAKMATETYTIPDNWSEELKLEDGTPMSKRYDLLTSDHIA